jgi:cytochrome c5
MARKLPFALSGCLLAIGIGALASPAIADDLPAGPGADVVQRSCSMCHALDHVTQIRKSRSDWENTVNLMLTYGLQISDDDRQKVIDYLSATYGLGAQKAPSK